MRENDGKEAEFGELRGPRLRNRGSAPRRSSRPTHRSGQRRKPAKKFNGLHRRRARRVNL